jgi:hypothetical protein
MSFGVTVTVAAYAAAATASAAIPPSANASKRLFILPLLFQI